MKPASLYRQRGKVREKDAFFSVRKQCLCLFMTDVWLVSTKDLWILCTGVRLKVYVHSLLTQNSNWYSLEILILIGSKFFPLYPEYNRHVILPIIKRNSVFFFFLTVNLKILMNSWEALHSSELTEGPFSRQCCLMCPLKYFPIGNPETQSHFYITWISKQFILSRYIRAYITVAVWSELLEYLRLVVSCRLIVSIFELKVMSKEHRFYRSFKMK